MGLQICPRCGRFHYVPGDCPQPKSTGSAEGRAAERPGRHSGETPLDKTDGSLSSAGGSQRVQPVLKPGPVDTKKVGRPRIHPDRKAYKAQKERERRAKAKAH